MINAKILSDTSTFNAVKYNDGKTKDKGDKLHTGKLLSMVNFPKTIKEKEGWTVERIKDYFKGYGEKNTRIKNQQFHAVLSVKGKALDDKQLENAAHLFVAKMGYGNVPHLIYFHNDTDNNHVHIVSTRVGEDGKKINSAFEKNRSQEVIKEISRQFGFIIPIDFNVARDLAFKFKYSNESQFNLLMEGHGLKVFKNDETYSYSKGGKKYGDISKDEILKGATEIKKKLSDNNDRIKQIKAVIYKYSKDHSPEIKVSGNIIAGQRPVEGNPKGKFTSDLADFLKEKFGIGIIYHGNVDNGKPYGYSLTDNVSQTVFKGSEIMPLQTMLTADKEIEDAQKEVAPGRTGQTEKQTTSSVEESNPGFTQTQSINATEWLAELNALFDELKFAEGDGQENQPANKKRKKVIQSEIGGMER